MPSKEAWGEVLRVLKPGAVLMAFGGTRTWHRLAVAIEDAGFRLFDTMMWLYGSGFPKSHNIGKAIDKAAGTERETIRVPAARVRNPKSIQGGHGVEGGDRPWMQEAIDRGYHEVAGDQPITPDAATWDGYGTALKPAWEPILLARKPHHTTYAQTAIEHGTACLNIEGCSIASNKPHTINTWDDGAKPFGNGAGHPFTSRQQSGRWPANILLSHLPECKRTGAKKIKAVPGGSSQRNSTLSEEYWGQGGGGFKVGRSTVSHADPDGTETIDVWKCVAGCPVATLGDVAHFFYTAKANLAERDRGLKGHLPCLLCGRIDTEYHHMKGKIQPCRRNPHPTVKPLAICEYLARLIIPPLGYRDDAALLVPYCGSGSEILGALSAGWRNVTGIDIAAEYLNITRLRIDAQGPRQERMM